MRYALVNFHSILLFVAALVIGLSSRSLMVLLIGLSSSIVLVGLISRLKIFRHHVDERLMQIERAAAAQVRATLMIQMEPKHRDELRELESLVDAIRGNVKNQDENAQEVLDDCLGLGRLIEGYVRLAIAYKASEDHLSSVDREALQEEINSLIAKRNQLDERMRKLSIRRLLIAEKRAERWDKTKEELEVIKCQIATIVDLVHLMYEHTVAPPSSGHSSEKVDQLVSSLEENEATLRELVELRAEDGVTSKVLELGRLTI